MNIEDQFLLDHLTFTERKCRSCGATKDLLTDFYRTRRNRHTVSAYSYECKDCTKKRVKSKKRNQKEDMYPDW
jgi:predicted nucleic acid-binding Zn ribbon protein